MKNNNILIGALLVIIIVGGGLWITQKPASIPAPGPVGAAPSYQRNCVSTTWYPGAVGSTTVASTNVTLLGVNLGDFDDLTAQINTSTQGLVLKASPTSTNTVFVTLADPDNSGTAITMTTSTLKVCDLKYFF